MKYSKPRIKTIYPVYRLDSETFRIGSQKNITIEFEDPTGEMWDLINFMDGRTIEDLLRAMQNKYPDITLDEVEYGIDLLDKEKFLEEYKEDKSDRYTGKSINCQFEIDYEKGASFRHQPWSRYPEDCPTCGIGNENHWEVFSYYGLR